MNERTSTAQEKYERQLQIEKDALELSYDRLMKQIEERIKSGDADELLEGRWILHHAINAVADKIKEFFSLPLRGKSGQAKQYLADFEDSPKDLAYIIVVTMVRLISKTDLVPATAMITQLNRSLYHSILVRRLENKGDNLSAYCERRFKTRGRKYIEREKLKIAKHQNMLGDSSLNAETIKVGAFLIDLVIQSGVNIIEKVVVRDGRGSTKTHIRYTEECYKLILQSRELLLGEYRKFPIHIIPPKPWTEFKGSGGYHSEELYKIDAIKTEKRKEVSRYFKETGVSEPFEILNALQATAWRVNRRVFDVMSEIFDNNLIDPTMPRNNPKLYGGLPYNGFLEAADFVNEADYGEYEIATYDKIPVFKDKERGRQYWVAIRAQEDICTASNSKAMMTNLVLYNAREYLQEPEIYFSYQYDFRGRIYPIQQHLQPQGPGFVKALLEFADGDKLDSEDAVHWFMVHGANCYGYDKEPYAERISLISEKREDILAIAEDPMGNRDKWSEADAPFLFLAWCFEYADYVRDPDNFVSRLPVALDATCSGIQIYSGLLLDSDGARAVNVIGDQREDIYQKVADKVNEFLTNGEYMQEIVYNQSDGTTHHVDTKPLADSLKGKVNRRLTKRNTMTQPYSVTFRGMKDQLVEELNDMDSHNEKFWVGENWLAAMFLADLNARAIESVVKGAKVGQAYLVDVTRDLALQSRWVAYRAPLTQFPVIQRINRTKVERIQTAIGKLSIKTTIPNELDIRKMRSGVAPNYVHSLDAALLGDTVLRLHRLGCSKFHMIHDSYGVPAKYVVDLNREVRESFIKLFESDPLESWYNQVGSNYEVLPSEVMIGTLDLNQVRDSQYIFS
jgi:DNA-directed RNA polymerase